MGSEICIRDSPKMMQRIVELDLSDDVVQPGFVRDEELRELFAISSVFFFPSLYEGFGLTPLEAMAAGVPVVSSGRSAMREVLDTAAHLVDPEQYGECAAAIWEVLGNREYANVLREKGRKRAQQFSWSRTGEKTLEAYERFARLT